mmetsp:Transcript_9469/g.20556  ORF Transcript_9469/g.20556 Transcript_9469/m.20556 type:complete len:261 (-) Transcript_9469:871-1653(-)
MSREAAKVAPAGTTLAMASCRSTDQADRDALGQLGLSSTFESATSQAVPAAAAGPASVFLVVMAAVGSAVRPGMGENCRCRCRRVVWRSSSISPNFPAASSSLSFPMMAVLGFDLWRNFAEPANMWRMPASSSFQSHASSHQGVSVSLLFDRASLSDAGCASLELAFGFDNKSLAGTPRPEPFLFARGGLKSSSTTIPPFGASLSSPGKDSGAGDELLVLVSVTFLGCSSSSTAPSSAPSTSPSSGPEPRSSAKSFMSSA